MPGGGFREMYFDNPDAEGQIGIKDIEDRILYEKNQSQPDEKQIKTWQRWKNIFFVENKQTLYNNILSRMQRAGMVFAHPLSNEDWIKFSQWQEADRRALNVLPEPFSGAATPKTGSVTATSVSFKSADASIDGDPNSPVTESENSKSVTGRLSGASKDDQTIHYVYFGDLLALIYDNATGGESFVALDTEMEALQKIAGADGIRDLSPGTGGLPIDLKQSDLNAAADIVEAQGVEELAVARAEQRDAGSTQRLTELREKFHIILGNIDVSLARPNGSEDFTCNLAHVPVSLEVFRQFWSEKVLSKDVVFYSFFSFLDDMVQDMLTQALSSGCFDGLIDQPVRAQTVLATSANPISSEVYAASPLVGTGESNPGLLQVFAENSSPSKPAFKKAIPIGQDGYKAANPWQYLIVQASERAPSDLEGLYGEDTLKGIIHLGYGRDRGLLKTATFEKTNQEYLPEARYASEGNFVFNQLANVYDATFTMIGNNLFSPGKYIYFDTSDQGMGSPPEREEDSSGNVIHRSWSNIMGLGGYHLVTEISNVIDKTGYNTSVKARWTTSGVKK